MVSGSSHTHSVTLWEQFQEAVQSGQLSDYCKKRWQKVEDYAAWLSETHLPSLPAEQAAQLYRASGGTRSKEFKTNSIDEVRDSLDFLLYDTIKLESRFDECVSEEGAYKLTGAGKDYVSYLLCVRDPNLFGIWNNHAERALPLCQPV